jgi:hypothetical protein
MQVSSLRLKFRFDDSRRFGARPQPDPPALFLAIHEHHKLTLGFGQADRFVENKPTAASLGDLKALPIDEQLDTNVRRVSAGGHGSDHVDAF